jgi:hypothetical protein
MDHQKRTEGQLQQVEERLAILQEIMDQTADDDSAKPSSQRRSKTRRSRTERDDSSEGEERGWQEIPLEY